MTVDTFLEVGDHGTASPGPGCRVRYRLLLLSGEQVTACVRDGYVNVKVAVSVRSRDPVSGLLGDADGDPTNDIRVRGGQPLGLTPYSDEFYRSFGASWRVPAGQELLGPASGAIPECGLTPFRIHDLVPAVRIHATQVCLAGDVDPSQIDACVTDVAMMGDAAVGGFSGVAAPRAVVTLRERNGCDAPCAEEAPVLVGSGCAAGTTSHGWTLLALGAVVVMAGRRRARGRARSF